MSKRKVSIRIFSLSFLILFLELALIRWIPGHLRLVGFFSNLILLGTFLGMGVGILMARHKINLIVFFPVILAFLVFIVVLFRIEVIVSSPNALYFKAIPEKNIQVEPEIILPAVFLLCAFIFASISQDLGRLFSKVENLAAYSADICGSLAGIILFSILSYFSTPAYAWFLAAFIIYFYLIADKPKKYLILTSIIMVLVTTVTYMASSGSVWSPYYKITVREIPDSRSSDKLYALNVNNISHQYIGKYQSREPYYYLPYQLFKEPKFEKILIIGSGGGPDVATALGLNPYVSHIDAVEIDPKIGEYGKILNPDKPYDDKRVSLHITDGRAFVQNTDKKYDLIIYALTDSLVLTSYTSNVRLESFLFTKEAFNLAKDHLTGNGLFVLYNYYREDWLIDKIAKITESVFGYPPYEVSYGGEVKGAIFLTGPKIKDILPGLRLRRMSIDKPIDLASDDWPFLYLREKGIPWFYLKFLAVIFIISIITVALTFVRKKERYFDWRFFTFGAGFMLLETKSLVTFGLLFGNTWLVNSLVIAAILLFVLLANLVSMRFSFNHMFIAYVLLFGILVLNYTLPISYFLKLSLTVRYVAASVFYFSPVFLANLIFSQFFKDSSRADVSIGSNLLGAVLGGLLEYLSLAFGYRFLIIIIGLFYLLSLLKIGRVNIIKT